MARASTIRPSSLFGTVMSGLLFLLFIAVSATAVRELIQGVFIGSIAFLIWRIVIVRGWICRHHRRGIRHCRRGQFKEGIAAFTLSQRFWRRWAWLDRLRAPILGSAVAWPFGLLARYNIAYCQVRLGRGDEALRMLNGLLEERPDMTIAIELRGALRAGASAARELTDDPDWAAMLEEETTIDTAQVQ